MKKICFSKVYGSVHSQVIRVRARDLQSGRRAVKVKDAERKSDLTKNSIRGMQGVEVMLNQSRLKHQVIQKMIVKMVKVKRKCQILSSSASMSIMKST